MPKAVSGTVHAIRVLEVETGVIKEGFLEEVRLELGFTEWVGCE